MILISFSSNPIRDISDAVWLKDYNSLDSCFCSCIRIALINMDASSKSSFFLWVYILFIDFSLTGISFQLSWNSFWDLFFSNFVLPPSTWNSVEHFFLFDSRLMKLSNFLCFVYVPAHRKAKHGWFSKTSKISAHQKNWSNISKTFSTFNHQMWQFQHLFWTPYYFKYLKNVITEYKGFSRFSHPVVW